MSRTLDHLVIGAATLEQGAAWCEATFGVAPGPGGKHALMGTHNRLLSLACEAFPRCYLEIIAIDPDAPAPARRRWFDLDDAAVQDRAVTDVTVLLDDGVGAREAVHHAAILKVGTGAHLELRLAQHVSDLPAGLPSALASAHGSTRSSTDRCRTLAVRRR